MKIQQAGVGLLELLLVLAIGAMIVNLSINQYRIYRTDTDAMQLKGNADAIFQALGMYYKKECYGSVDSSGNLVPGDLHPAHFTDFAASAPSSVAIDISTQLMTPGYLEAQFVDNKNPLINTTGASGRLGFVAQFNLTKPLPSRLVCMSGSQQGSPPGVNCATSKEIGKIVIWRAQVAIRLKDVANAAKYRDFLGADCLSSDSGTGLVTPCATSGNTGNYLVWERLPLNASPESRSTYWPSTPVVSQFTQMYRVTPASSILNGSVTDTQYYVCVN